MARVFIFTDESGNMDFSRNRGATRYFLLTSITSPNCEVGEALQTLRRELAWEGTGLNSEFHATADRQAVRDRVFAMLRGVDFQVHATIIDKAKVPPPFRTRNDYAFYAYAWYEHLRLVAPRVVSRGDEVLVVNASLYPAKGRKALYEAVEPMIGWMAPGAKTRTAHWSCASDPCLQVADYCCWAIFRKWEHQDPRSYDLIADKIAGEHDIHAGSSAQYY